MDQIGFLIQIKNLPDERLVEYEREFTALLAREKIVTLKKTTAPKAGDRGAALDIGQIAVTLMTSGAAVAMIECVKVYFSRNTKLVFKFTKKDGDSFEVNSENIRSSEIQEMIKSLSKIFADDTKDA